MKFKLTLFIIGILISMTPIAKVNAGVNTRHNVIYTIDKNLATTVTHTVHLTYDDKYNGISKITIEEPVSDIENLSKSTAKRSYSILNTKNKVEILFTDLLVGPTSIDIEYSYKTNSLIKKIGTTYSLEIPRVTGNEIEEYNLKIYVPTNIPLNEYVSKLKSDNLGTFLLFSKTELENSGRFLNFGKEIYFELAIKHIVSPEKDYIVIPPIISGRQEVFIESISKTPQKIYKDFDNNLIFKYNNLKNIESINGKYLIKVYGNKSNEAITQFKEYLQPIKNWNFKVGIPLEITKKIIDSANPIDGAFYNTINSLEYNPNSISYNTNLRVGAENLTEENSKNAVCLEYSDLLIAVLRGIGVPAREINGLNYKNDINYFSEPELHSWVEYYNDGGWTQVDPTFADTSDEDYLNNFDIFHITFLRRSTNSEYPILTGSFAKNNLTEQLKINTVNIPNKSIIKIKYIDLLLTYFVINDSYSYIGNIAPKSSSFVAKSNFAKLKDFNTEFFKIELEKATITEIINSEKEAFLIVLVSCLVSVVSFYVLHYKLKKSTKHKKDKVSRIV